MDVPTPQDPLLRVAKVKEFGEHGGVNGSIEMSTTFTVLNADTLPAIFQGHKGPDRGCYVYGRSFNPTVRALAKQLAALEDTEAAYATSSGMAAISSALLALCNTGDHIVASNTVYGGTFALLKSFLPTKCNVHTTFVDITDTAAVKAAMQPNTKVVYTETISNPTLVVSPLPDLAAIAHAAGAQMVVDNTFTPCIITPKTWGADVIVHSMTKFISGASDIIAGCVCGTQQFINSLMHFHTGPLMLLGPTMDPRIAGELALRLPHLGLRMQEHSRRAQTFAERLHAAGAHVTYPGLPSHSGYTLLKKLANPGYGLCGLMGLDLGSKAAADAFMERLQNKHGFGYMAVSLGYFDTLMSVSGASTSSELEPSELAASGIQPGYVRMSIGITGTLEQRWSQLEDAYNFIVKGGANAPYRAIKVVGRSCDGATASLLSWPSLGSDLSELQNAEDLLTQPAINNITRDLLPTVIEGASPSTSEGETAVAAVEGISVNAVDGATAEASASTTLKPLATRGSVTMKRKPSCMELVPGTVVHIPVDQGMGSCTAAVEGLEESGEKVKIRRLQDGVTVVYQPKTA